MGIGGVGVFMKEEICETVVEVRRSHNRVVVAVLIVEEEGASNLWVWPAHKVEEDLLKRAVVLMKSQMNGI